MMRDTSSTAEESSNLRLASLILKRRVYQSSSETIGRIRVSGILSGEVAERPSPRSMARASSSFILRRSRAHR